MRKLVVVLTFLVVLGVVLGLILVAVGRDEKEETLTPSAPALPKSGEWNASTEFGELAFTVNPDGTGITKISLRFSQFRCGPVTLSGESSVENSWAITDGQFTANVDFGPSRTMNSGTFDETGTHASGTWEVNSAGTICSGNWESH